ncbi:MAG: type II toxin-antitoxin system VapC family toxin [Polyangiaceae bacterium]
MKLEGEQLVLDTNILVHWLRGKGAGLKLREDYELGARRPRPIIPLVVKAEIKSLALQFNWGDQRNEQLDALLRELPVADISSEAVIQAYAHVDHESRQVGRRMGKNDLWIAAVAFVQGAVILTTDKDFDHLAATVVRIESVDVSLQVKPVS